MQHLLKTKLIKTGFKSKGYLRLALSQFFLYPLGDQDIKGWIRNEKGFTIRLANTNICPN